MAYEISKQISSHHPMHIVLVADNSESMKGAPAADVSQGIAEWIVHLQMQTRGIRAYFRFSYLVFGSVAEILVENEDINSIDGESVFLTGEGGSTNVAEALYTAGAVIERSKPPEEHCRPYVFLYTDGLADDTASAERAAHALKSMQLACGAPYIVTLGFGQADHDFLRKVASGNGGEFHLPCADSNTLRRLLPRIGTPGKTRAATEAGFRAQIADAARRQERFTKFEPNLSSL